MKTRTWLIAAVALCGMCSVGFGDLLLNEGMAEPNAGASACVHGVATPPSNWTKVNNPGASVGFNRNNGLLSQITQICDAVGGSPDPGEDGVYATLENGNRGGGYVHQTASSLTASEFYRVSFRWANLWTNNSTPYLFRVEARSGTDPVGGSVLGFFEETFQDGGHDLEAKSFVVQATSTDITVVWIIKPVFSAPSCCDFLLSHMDYLSLEVAACVAPPVLDPTPMTPSTIVRGVSTPVTITGSSFTLVGSETISVRLESPTNTITATSATVDNDNQISATFDTSATDHPGLYTLVVQRAGELCDGDPASVNSAGLLILPSLTNGDFEEEALGAVDCAPQGGVPTDWQATETRWGFSNRGNRNSFITISAVDTELAVKPSCPAPDGDYYGTMASATDDGGDARMWQTIPVTNGSTYVLSGQIASSSTGGLTGHVQLRDGDQNGAILGETEIINSVESAAKDFAFFFVEGTATSDMMTIALNVVADNGAAGEKAIHADSLVIGECTSSITLNGITDTIDSDNQGVNDAVAVIADLSGTGFAGTPQVFLSKPGTTIEATNVQVVSGTQITCDLDITGASSGRYDVIVLQDNCVAELEAGYLVIGEELINGSFELPTPGLGTCSGRIGGPIDGWNSITDSGDGSLVRNSQAPPPDVCPNPADGGHYGSLSGTVTTVRASQTLSVLPGVSYTFGGEFSGGPGNVIANLNIRQGDDTAPVDVGLDAFGGNGQSGAGGPWIAGEVVAVATGNVMTVEVEMVSTQATGGGVNMDGVFFKRTFDCSNPRADADADGDVDQMDFATYQLCASISPYDAQTEVNGYTCGCFDLQPGGGLTSGDFTLFAACTSGPDVPADDTCDD